MRGSDIVTGETQETQTEALKRALRTTKFFTFVRIGRLAARRNNRWVQL